MASPTKITYDYSFLDHTVNDPDVPQPGDKLDEAFAEVKRASDETIDRLNLIQRDDGELGRVVGPDQLKEPLFTEFENLANAAEQSAQDAAASAAEAGTYRDEVEANASAAALSATNAANSASASQISAENSAISAGASLSNADAAANSAIAAAASKTGADTAAALAGTRAQDAADSADASEASAQASAASAASANTALGGLVGGTAGQALIKASASDFDYSWLTLTGGGDMLKAVYDPNGDGVVDEATHAMSADEAAHAASADHAGSADTANSVAWANILGRPAFGTAATLDAGVANGVASLDSTGKVPSSQLPAMDYLPSAGGILSGRLTIDSPNGLVINAASALYFRSDDTKQMVFQNAAGTVNKGFIQSSPAGAITVVPVDAAGNIRVFSFNPNGQLALPVTSTASDAAVRRDDMLARITEVNNTIAGRAIADWITTVGLIGNDANQPYVRRASDGLLVTMQRALGYTPVRQATSNVVQLYWNGGGLTYDIDFGGAVQQIVDGNSLGAWLNNYAVVRQNGWGYNLGGGAGGGSGQIVLTANLNSSGVSLRTTDRGTVKGDIALNTNGTVTYGSVSDYRLKQDVVPLVSFTITEDEFNDLDNSLLRVMGMRPVSYRFIDAPDELIHGFIAHELQQVAPHAVTGTKDATEEIGTAVIAGAVVPGYTRTETQEDEDGNPVEVEIQVPETKQPDTVYEGVTQDAYPDATSWTKTGERPIYQQVDPAKTIADLTAAVQSLTLMVLEQRGQIAALQNAAS